MDSARHSPSGANTQPWQVAAIQGETKAKISTTLQKYYYAGEAQHPGNIMLAAEEKGLAICPQAALAEYPTLIKLFWVTPRIVLW